MYNYVGAIHGTQSNIRHCVITSALHYVRTVKCVCPSLPSYSPLTLTFRHLQYP